MKLKFDLSSHQVELVTEIIRRAQTSVSATETEKMYKSIGLDLLVKFENKLNVINRNCLIGSFKRSCKVTLKYHEALLLQKLIRATYPVVYDARVKSEIIMMISQLHPKLV